MFQLTFPARFIRGELTRNSLSGVWNELCQFGHGIEWSSATSNSKFFQISDMRTTQMWLRSTRSSNIRSIGWDCLGRTSRCDVVEVVRLCPHYDLVADDGVAVDVCTLSSTTWRIVLTQGLRSGPQLSCTKYDHIGQLVIVIPMFLRSKFVSDRLLFAEKQKHFIVN